MENNDPLHRALKFLKRHAREVKRIRKSVEQLIADKRVTNEDAAENSEQMVCDNVTAEEFNEDESDNTSDHKSSSKELADVTDNKWDNTSDHNSSTTQLAAASSVLEVGHRKLLAGSLGDLKI